MKAQETIRDDGLHIITCKVPSKKVYVGLVAGVGSAYDTSHLRGLFHYFEHMAFKGTHVRTVEEIHSFSRRNILSKNASTGQLDTIYDGIAIYKKFPQLCELLCDLYFNSIFPEEELEREKEVILNEIVRNRDKENYAATEKMRKILWQYNPLRISGVGTLEGVSNINRAILMAAKEKWYVPSNTIAVAAGNIDHNEFVKELKRHIPENNISVSHLAWSDEYDTLPSQQEVIIERPHQEKVTIIFTCKFPLYADERDQAISHFLQYAMIAGPGSIVWKELREKRGLAYNLSGGITNARPLGSYFSLYVETLPNRIDVVRELVLRILFQPFTDKNVFEETKEYIGDWLSLGYENLDDWTYMVRASLQQGKTLKSTERHFSVLRKIISSITLDEVEKLRSATLIPERFVTVVVKPV